MAFPIAVLLPILADVGAPLLKRLIARHAAGAAGEAGSAVVDALAARLRTTATPEAVAAAYRADPDTAAAAIRQVEIDRREDWAEMLADVNATMRGEQQASGVLQRIWRPVFGLFYALAFAALALALVRALWLSDTAAINALAGISGFLIAFYGMGASVLGVYVWQRSAEKRAGAA
ncbi:holin (3TMs family) [Breoghania corrubedonensis]|uniref:Holin (3TMs family) n=1 Tax=Breoghania corrubedonensis TaxID=665038 RepID=A0A2T5V1M3_9HYPH|nr:3TM-type holin [Breoghania corrubedonensis]PTW57642.1 holin (3TMs family) [Breoghania corrubedonensis]